MTPWPNKKPASCARPSPWTKKLGTESRFPFPLGSADGGRYAQALDRSHVVNDALAGYVETHRWQTEHIRQGLREAEAGKFVADKDVKRLSATS
jgi:hypothetical protein